MWKDEKSRVLWRFAGGLGGAAVVRNKNAMPTLPQCNTIGTCIYGNISNLEGSSVGPPLSLFYNGHWFEIK